MQMAAICGFQNAFPSVVDLPAVSPPSHKLSHAIEAVTNNRQGFPLSVLAGEATHSAISLLATWEAASVVALLNSFSSFGDDSTWLKMVAWGSWLRDSMWVTPKTYTISQWLKVTYSFTAFCSSMTLSAKGWRFWLLGRLCFCAQYCRLLV